MKFMILTKTLSNSLKRSFSPRFYVTAVAAVLLSGLAVAETLSVLATSPPTTRDAQGLASAYRPRLGDEATVRAIDGGTPYLNLGEGRDLITSQSVNPRLHELATAGETRPLALSTADFDEDGVADIVSAQGLAAGGVLTMLRGNVDSIYPNSSGAERRRETGEFSDAPFFSPTYLTELSEPPDFIGAGDFDGDGHQDIVVGSRGRDTLSFLLGDGRGSFGEPRRLELPGGVTALGTGEINRRDGLDDLIVCVSSAGGDAALVYEGPEGALRSEPEVFSLPAPVTSLTLGQLDDDYPIDLAMAAGSNLVVVYGRDRKLSLDEPSRDQAQPAAVSKSSLPFEIASIALGDFVGDYRPDLVALTSGGALNLLERAGAGSKRVRGSASEVWGATLLAEGDWSPSARIVSARVSSVPVDNVLIADPDNERLQIFAKFGRREKAGLEGQAITGGDISAAFNVSGGPAAVLPMQLNTDALTDLVLLRKGSANITVMATVPQATASVTTNSSGGPGSLREAIENANRTPGLDTINFNIQGGGTQVISLINQLPEITDAVVIDGSTQPGGRVVLDGTGAGFGAEGLVVRSGNSRIRGLVYNNFTSGSNGQGGDGVVLLTNGGNVVEGNIVGLNSTGTAARGNSFGVYVINSSNNLIGGTTPEARNIISGNKSWGVILWEKTEFLSAGHTTGNTVRGNYIGTDITGAIAIGNGSYNIRLGEDLTGSVFANNTIGGTTAGARNVIVGSGKEFSGGRSAVYVRGRTITGTLIQGNYIGTDAAGTAALPNNGNGVQMLLATGNTIGGTAPGAGNIVAASTFPGIALGSFPEGIQNIVPTSNNLIQGNFVGTNAAGTAALGNDVGIIIGGFIAGDLVLATDNTVGGTVAGARNVISGNKGNGLMFINNGSRRNVAIGNFIGTNAAGTAALGNEGSGVVVTQALEITIGGSSPESRNVISGNRVHGIAVGIPSFGLTGGTGVRIEGNSIGTNTDGSLDLGNQLDGIFLDAKSVDNSIENNLIAFNKRNGIFIPNNNDSGKQIKILGNLIFANAQLGIDLGAPGVTPNDPLDVDGGANEQQNFPVVGDVSATGPAAPDLSGTIRTNAVTLNIPVSLNSTPNTQFTLDFYLARTCNTAGFTVAPERIGTRQMRTDPGGNANETFVFTLDRIPSGFLKVTATDPRGNTSEMSDQCKQITVNGGGGSCAIACPPNLTVAATSASGAVVNFQLPTLSGTCANVTIETSRQPGSTFPIGTTTVTATARDASGVRGTCSFTVTVTPLNGPRIDRVEKQGKKLFVFGSGFSNGAVILINNQSQKTSNDLFNPATSLIGKKAGKKIRVGDVVRVRNADGTLTPPFTYPNNGG
jgi:hypothetical protein